MKLLSGLLATSKKSYKGDTLFVILVTDKQGNRELYKIVEDIEKLTGFFVSEIKIKDLGEQWNI